MESRLTSSGRYFTPENFRDRIIFMTMFTDIEQEKRGNADSCAVSSRKIKEHASKFNDGHWAFLGPEEESKRYQGYTTNYGGKWDLRASQMVENFENSRHTVFQGMSPLGRGIQKRKIIETQATSMGSVATLTCCTRLFTPRNALYSWSSHKVVWKQA